MSQKIFDYENQPLVKTKTFINNKRIIKVVEIKVSSNYFNIKDTLDSGQIFRYKPFNGGFLVFSGDKACYAYEKDDKCFIQCDDQE